MMANRQALEQSNSEYKQQIEDELEELKSKAKTIGKQALIVGGGVLLVYAVVSMLSGDKEIKKPAAEQLKNNLPQEKSVRKYQKNEEPNFLTEVLKEQALVFILGIAAQKLGEFLKSLDQNKNS